MRTRHLAIAGWGLPPPAAFAGISGGATAPPAAGWDGFRIGSESCPRLLPEEGVLADLAETAGLPPSSLTLVTPMIGPLDLSAVLSRARRALEAGWGEVVVNDWGVLEDLSGTGRGKITVGRLLLRARRGPGSSDPWPSLDPASREYLAWGPLRDGALMAFIASKGATRLEIDPPRHWTPLPVPTGFCLSFHAEDRLVSLSGHCPHLFRGEEEGWGTADGCGRPCEGPPILLRSPRLTRPLIQRGSLVLEQAREDWREEDLPAEVDRLIFTG